MAEETTQRIIEVGIGNSAKTLGELREAVIQAKTVLLQLDAEVKNGTATEEEYQQQLVQTKAAMDQYNAEMRIQVKESQAAKGSYNDLVNQLARLKTEWKNATDMQKRGELTEQINQVKGTLEAMDHSIGNWQRNVGNYANSIRSVASLFGTTGKAASGAIGGISGMTAGLQAMSATPIIAILGVLVTLLQKVGDGFSTSEKNANKFNLIMAPFRALADASTKAMQDLTEACADFGLKLLGINDEITDSTQKIELFYAKLSIIAKLMSHTSGVWRRLSDAIDEQSRRTADNIKISQEEIELNNKRREYIKANAIDEQKSAELRAQANKKDSASLQEREALLEKVQAVELRIAERNIDLAKRELAVAKLKAEQTENDKEANDKLAEAEANVTRQTTNYLNKMRELNAQLAEVRNAMKAAFTVPEIEDKVDIVGVTEEQLKAAVKAEEKAMQQERALRQTREAERLAAIDRDEKRALAYNDVMLQTDREREQAAFDIQAASQQRRLEALQQFRADALAAGDVGAYLDYQQQAADLEVEIEVEKQRRLNQERKEAYDTYIGFAVGAANAVASVMGEVASAYEDEINRRVELGEITEDEGRKQFEVVKGMEIGVATMQMLTGITAALSGAFTTKSGPWDIALAAIQAASIAASGIINIAKIRKTQFNAKGGGSTASTPAIQAAPTVTTDVPQTRVVTNAEDEQTLNERMQAQRVYVVYSDIEGAGRQVQVQQQESSF